MMDNTFFHKRVIFCQERELGQNPSRLPHDQPYKSQRNTEIEQVQRYMIGNRRTKDHLVKIEPVTENQKYGHKSYRGPVPLGAPAHKDQQGAQEVDYQI